MNVIRFTDHDFPERLQALTNRSSLFDPMIEERTRAILNDVFIRGDAALLELTQRFDGAILSLDNLAVSKAEFLNASVQADASLREAVSVAGNNIELFSQKSLRRAWFAKNAQRAVVGEKFDPFRRVGIYVPGGTAPLVSTCLMTITLARVASCPEIVVCTPCDAN